VEVCAARVMAKEGEDGGMSGDAIVEAEEDDPGAFTRVAEDGERMGRPSVSR